MERCRADRDSSEAITDTILYTHGLAGWLAKETDTSVLEAAAADEPTKTWEAFKAIAEALTDDEARARLVARWTLAVRSEETTSAVRAAISGYRRSVRKAEAGDAEQARIASRHVQSVVDLYAKGLAAVADDWVRSELPQPAIRELSRRDLNVASAQEPLVKAIESDFSGRGPVRRLDH